MKKINIEFIDLTPKLIEKEHYGIVFPFNMSIAPIEYGSSIYLISYRKISCALDEDKLKQKEEIKNFSDKFKNYACNLCHPWNYWTMEADCSTKFSEKFVEYRKELQARKNFYHDRTIFGLYDFETNKFKLLSEEKYMYDTRLLYLFTKENQVYYLATYSRLIGANNKSKIIYNYLIFDKDFQSLKIVDPLGGRDTLMCRNFEDNITREISSIYDDNQDVKNWSPFLYNKRLYFSHIIQPKHVIYNTKYIKRSIYDYIGLCEIYKEGKSKFKKYSDDNIHIRLGAPATKFNDDEYISVGHIVILYKKLLEIDVEIPREIIYDRYYKPAKPSVINNFTKSVRKFVNKYLEKNLILHDHSVYLMFIYTFSPKTGDILRSSDFFYPFDKEKDEVYNSESKEFESAANKSLLVFPCGIAKNILEEKIIISYGDYDTFAKFLILTYDEINNLMREIEDPDDKNCLKPILICKK